MSGGHRDLATHPGAGLLDRLTWPWVFRPSRLEEVKDVLRARCRPQGEELVIRIGEGPRRRMVTKRGPRSRQDHTAHLLLASAQRVTHAPRVPTGRSGHDRIVLSRRRQSIEAPTGRALARIGEVVSWEQSTIPGAVYPRPLVAAVGAAQVKNSECGRRRRGQASARLIACGPSTCSAPQPD